MSEESQLQQVLYFRKLLQQKRAAPSPASCQDLPWCHITLTLDSVNCSGLLLWTLIEAAVFQ